MDQWLPLVNIITMVGVFWYAWEARKQAEATRRIAESGIRPILEQWIDETPVSEEELALKYRNIGNGPAVNMRWHVDGQTKERVSMGTKDVKGTARFSLTEHPPASVVCEYGDASGKLWVSRLELKRSEYGKLVNGLSSHSAAGLRRRGILAVIFRFP